MSSLEQELGAAADKLLRLAEENEAQATLIRAMYRHLISASGAQNPGQVVGPSIPTSEQQP